MEYLPGTVIIYTLNIHIYIIYGCHDKISRLYYSHMSLKARLVSRDLYTRIVALEIKREPHLIQDVLLLQTYINLNFMKCMYVYTYEFHDGS